SDHHYSKRGSYNDSSRPSHFLHSFLLKKPQPPRPTLFPYTTLFRSEVRHQAEGAHGERQPDRDPPAGQCPRQRGIGPQGDRDLRSEEHTSELQSLTNIVCRLLLEKKTRTTTTHPE